MAYRRLRETEVAFFVSLKTKNLFRQTKILNLKGYQNEEEINSADYDSDNNSVAHAGEVLSYAAREKKAPNTDTR